MWLCGSVCVCPPTHPHTHRRKLALTCPNISQRFCCSWWCWCYITYSPAHSTSKQGSRYGPLVCPSKPSFGDLQRICSWHPRMWHSWERGSNQRNNDIKRWRRRRSVDVVVLICGLFTCLSAYFLLFFINNYQSVIMKLKSWKNMGMHAGWGFFCFFFHSDQHVRTALASFALNSLLPLHLLTLNERQGHSGWHQTTVLVHKCQAQAIIVAR